MTSLGPLIESAAYRMLLPVRGDEPIMHYVPRDGAVGVAGLEGVSLCHKLGPLTGRGGVLRNKWRRLKNPCARTCQICAQAACSEPTRVDWT